MGRMLKIGKTTTATIEGIEGKLRTRGVEVGILPIKTFDSYESKCSFASFQLILSR